MLLDKNNLKYIYLIDDKYYRVKIRVNLDDYINRSFSFEKYTKKIALIEAIKFRDEVLITFNLTERLSHVISPNLFRRNKEQACVGVFRSSTKNANGQRLYNWTCRYSKDETNIFGTFQKEYKKHFSIKKYGDCGAFKLACALRVKHCGKLIVLNKKLLPCSAEYFSEIT